MRYLIQCTLISILILPQLNWAYELTNLTRNEPYSFYTTRYRYEFLDTALKYTLFTGEPHPQERFRFTATPFRESATDKKIEVDRDPTNDSDDFICGNTIINIIPEITGCPAGRDFKKRKVPLGDIMGRLNMLALFYDELENCPVIPPNASKEESTTLQKQCPTVQYFYPTLCSFINPTTSTLDLINNCPVDEFVTCTCITEFIDPVNTDTNQFLGFFSIPLDYKKHGIRFDFDYNICNDIDIELNFGFAEIKVTNTRFIDLSCDAPIIACTNCCDTESCTLFGTDCCCLTYLEDNLMRKVRKIAKELCIDIEDFCITGFEDIRVGLHWHHTYAACPDQHGHPLYLFTPFVLVEGSIPTAEKISNRKLLALPLGNNGHGAVGFTAGFNFDYNAFFSAGVDAGLTHFTGRQYFNLPMPTADLQAVFFPFSVDACIEPGNNWHASATLMYTELYHHISIFTQYLQVNHDEDKVTIRRDLRLQQPLIPNNTNETCNMQTTQFQELGGFSALPDFLPRLFERESKWDYESLIFGFNYDFCDNYGLGFLWQTPISGRRSFCLTTLAFSFSAVF